MHLSFVLALLTQWLSYYASHLEGVACHVVLIFHIYIVHLIQIALWSLYLLINMCTEQNSKACPVVNSCGPLQGTKFLSKSRPSTTLFQSL